MPKRSYAGESTYTGNALHSRQRGRQHVPVGFVFRKIQKIILTIDFKLQFVFSLEPVAPASRRLSPGRRRYDNRGRVARDHTKPPAELRSAWTGRRLRSDRLRPVPTRPVLKADG